MPSPMHRSPEVEALDLLRVDLNSFWNIDDLIDHEGKIKACVLALVGVLLDRRDNISPEAAANIKRLQRRLNARLAPLYAVLARLREEAAEPNEEPVPPKKGSGAAAVPKF